MEGRIRPKRFLLQKKYKLKLLQRSPHTHRVMPETNPKPVTDFLSHLLPPPYAQQLAVMPEVQLSEGLAIHTLGSMAYVAELLNRVSKLSASEVHTRRLEKELELCKKVVTIQEEKIDQVCGQLTDAKAKIVELRKRAVNRTTKAMAVKAKLRKLVRAAEARDKDMAECLEKLSLEKETVEKKYASLVDDTDWLLGNGLPLFRRLLKSRDFLVDSSYLHAACVDYGFQKGCLAMRDKLAVNFWDKELPDLDPEINKKVQQAYRAFGEAKFDILEDTAEDDHVMVSHMCSLSKSLIS